MLPTRPLSCQQCRRRPEGAIRVRPARPDLGPDRVDQLFELVYLVQHADPGPRRRGGVVDDAQPLGHGALDGAEPLLVPVGFRAQRLAPLPRPVLQLRGVLPCLVEQGAGRVGILPGGVAEPSGLPGQRGSGFLGVPDDQRRGLLGRRRLPAVPAQRPSEPVGGVGQFLPGEAGPGLVLRDRGDAVDRRRVAAATRCRNASTWMVS